MWGCTSDPYDLDGPARVMRSVELLLAPEQLLSILRDFTLFDRPFRDGAPTLVKLISRYPQVEGVEAIHRRVLDSARRRGLIWHYQGTGKTLLMAFAALRLLEDERGIIVTTVFRFEGAGLLNRRRNIVVLVDEAHRTQEGRLGEDMRTALPNAHFFGLTGTPIAAGDRNTFKLFGDPDDPGYVLNQYSIERSIADGSSVPVHVETRLVDFHIDKEALDAAFEAMAEEEQLEDAERELLAERASSARTFMHNPDR